MGRVEGGVALIAGTVPGRGFPFTGPVVPGAAGAGIL